MQSVCPPPKKKVSVLISLIFTSISLSTYAYEITGENPSFDWSNGNNFTCEELNIDITPEIRGNYYTIEASNGKTFTVNKKTVVSSVSNNYVDNWDPIAVYIFHAKGSGVINLNGDVEAISLENVSIPDEVSYAGVNLFYAQEGGTINIGSPGSTVKAWALAKKPDLISAKKGAKVIFHSTHNELVGSIDMIGNDAGMSGSRISLTLSGSNSYWFGDEQTWYNMEGTDSRSDLALKFAQLFMSDEFNLIIEDEAQWTYFGFSEGGSGLGYTFRSIPKRISSITLQNRGIINLFDHDIQKTWEDIGLTNVWSDLTKINHDYVRIGDLKGSGGIFRLDLDAENKQNSDMVFIESSSTGGQHYIEPYDIERLESVSPTNTLTFALTHKDANREGKVISFAEKENIYGQSLFDYELEIDSRDIQDADQISEIHYDSWEKDDWDFDPEEYVDGKEWFIKRVTLSESAASIGMRSAGYASYDLAVSMDRHDRRLQNAVFQNEEKNGLWARVQYGEAGAEHLYNADLTTVYVGYEKATSADNRLGFSFAYTDGESDLNDLKGSGDLKRYEASVYDTLTFGSHYLDFVARFGQVDNEFDVTNQSGALTTSGSFDQKYAALSAEYGYNFKDEHNVFIEPQVQLQVAYLDDYNYRTERNMKVDADSDISVIGRVGLRAGKAFESSDYVGELYARADVLHQFTDGQDAQFSDLSNKVGVTWGDKDTWSTFGVGGYLNWKDNVSFQVDVERTAGGETIDTWLVSGRVNYLF